MPPSSGSRMNREFNTDKHGERSVLVNLFLSQIRPAVTLMPPVSSHKDFNLKRTISEKQRSLIPDARATPRSHVRLHPHVAASQGVVESFPRGPRDARCIRFHVTRALVKTVQIGP